MPISVEPAHYYKNVDKVIGRSPVQTVATGLPVTEQAFGRRNALAEAIPPGTQAMSLIISDVTAVGGFVQPGDFVDVLLYLRSSGEQIRNSQARVLIRDVRVLAYARQLINGEQVPDQNTDSRARRERTAVLAVPQAETTRVMLGASLGELRLALRAGPSAADPGSPGGTGCDHAGRDCTYRQQPGIARRTNTAALAHPIDDRGL